MATMVSMNTGMLNGKDSRWLQLEVCREFQRNKCTRPDTECKFSHPAANVEIQNGRVTACYDSIKGRCNREKPPCKYFHPPLHLKEQLLINGRNHLALKNALMQQIGIAPGHAMLPGQVSAVVTTPYITGIPTSTYSPYFAPGHLVPTIMGPDPSGGHTVIPQGMPVAQQKIPRSEVTNNMTCYYAHSYTHYQLQPRNESSCHPVTAQQPPTHTIVPYVQVQQPKDRIVHYIRASDQMVPSIPQPFRAHCG